MPKRKHWTSAHPDCPNFAGANNTFKDNFCLTYIQGAGPATVPCPNIGTEGLEGSASRLTSPPHGEKGSNGLRTAPSRLQMASAIASFLAVVLGWAFSTPVIRSESPDESVFSGGASSNPVLTGNCGSVNSLPEQQEHYSSSESVLGGDLIDFWIALLEVQV